jgi:hypothetical protein
VADPEAWVALQGSSVVAVRVASGKPVDLDSKPVDSGSKPVASGNNKVDSANNKVDSANNKAALDSRADSAKPAVSAELQVVEHSQADSAEREFPEELESFPITLANNCPVVSAARRSLESDLRATPVAVDSAAGGSEASAGAWADSVVADSVVSVA